MIRAFVAAIAFLTRLPVGLFVTLGPDDVGRSARWFPVAGALIGGFSVLGWLLFRWIFPPYLTATLIVAIGALVTGALHLDGVADTADGFGAGGKVEDILRIMRDHSIGSYGAVALFLVLALKIGAIAMLIQAGRPWRYLLLAPALGRWPAVALSSALPYVERTDGVPSKGGIATLIHRTELLIATLSAVAIAALAVRWQALIFCPIVLVCTALWGLMCKRRIGGITGDTLGAAVEISEIAVLLSAVALK